MLSWGVENMDKPRFLSLLGIRVGEPKFQPGTVSFHTLTTACLDHTSFS